MKDLLIIGIIGAALYYGTRVMSAKKVGDKSIVRAFNPRIVKTDNNGIVVRFDVAVDNPTNTSVRLSRPVITISSQGKYLVSSIPESRFFQIAPLSQSSLDSADITIPWVSLSGYLADILVRIPSLLKSFQQTGRLDFQQLAIPLEYKYSTYVNDLYYESPLTRIL
jgi:hypothetical protein